MRKAFYLLVFAILITSCLEQPQNISEEKLISNSSKPILVISQPDSIIRPARSNEENTPAILKRYTAKKIYYELSEEEIEQDTFVGYSIDERDTINTVEQYKHLLGYYVGEFLAKETKKGGSLSNTITIAIDKITSDSIFGHSVVAGNIRPFMGVFDTIGYFAQVTEPGDEKYDGTFHFQIYLHKKPYDNSLRTHQLKGKWFANNKDLKVTERQFDLEAVKFVYHPNIAYTMDQIGDNYRIETGNRNSKVGEYISAAGFNPLNASLQLLTKKDIENMYKADLEFLRNTIYARHGYSFKNRKMRYLFAHFEQYIPITTDVRHKLTTLEKKNIALIKRYENHAEIYYDQYGR